MTLVEAINSDLPFSRSGHTRARLIVDEQGFIVDEEFRVSVKLTVDDIRATDWIAIEELPRTLTRSEFHKKTQEALRKLSLGRTDSLYPTMERYCPVDHKDLLRLIEEDLFND